MTIIVEDGSNVANANSYVTTAELDAFASARNVNIPSPDREFHLIGAMDYFEQLSFIGIKANKTQALQWPRVSAYIDGYPVNGDEIPKEVKNAQMQIALSIHLGYSPTAVIEPAVKREKVGDLEVEYADTAAPNPIDPKISAAIRKLVDGGQGRSFTVGKA